MISTCEIQVAICFTSLRQHAARRTPATPSSRRPARLRFLPVPHIPQRSGRVAPSLRYFPRHQVRWRLQRLLPRRAACWRRRSSSRRIALIDFSASCLSFSSSVCLSASSAAARRSFSRAAAACLFAASASVRLILAASSPLPFRYCRVRSNCHAPNNRPITPSAARGYAGPPTWEVHTLNPYIG